MSFLFGKRKVKITKTEFASVLEFLLSKGLEEESQWESIAKFAESIDFEIKNKKDSIKLFQELLVLHMWVIIHACSKVFSDVDKRNSCLDIFNRNVYKALYKNTTEQGYSQWINSFGLRYLEYEEATEKVDKPGTMWWLSKAVNKNIFGEVKEDAIVHMHIAERIGTFMEYVDDMLEKTMKNSQIE